MKPRKEDMHAYDHKIDREMTSEIIIYHDFPFRYAKYEKVRARDKYANLFLDRLLERMCIGSTRLKRSS